MSDIGNFYVGTKVGAADVADFFEENCVAVFEVDKDRFFETEYGQLSQLVYEEENLSEVDKVFEIKGVSISLLQTCVALNNDYSFVFQNRMISEELNSLIDYYEQTSDVFDSEEFSINLTARLTYDAANVGHDKFSDFHDLLTQHVKNLIAERENFHDKSLHVLKTIFENECVIYISEKD